MLEKQRYRGIWSMTAARESQVIACYSLVYLTLKSESKSARGLQPFVCIYLFALHHAEVDFSKIDRTSIYFEAVEFRAHWMRTWSLLFCWFYYSSLLPPWVCVMCFDCIRNEQFLLGDCLPVYTQQTVHYSWWYGYLLWMPSHITASNPA